MDFKTRSRMTSACQGCISGASLACSIHSEQALVVTWSPAPLELCARSGLALEHREVQRRDTNPSHPPHPHTLLLSPPLQPLGAQSRKSRNHICTATHTGFPRASPSSQPRRIAVLVSSTGSYGRRRDRKRACARRSTQRRRCHRHQCARPRYVA